jgi:uncharacterized membrane protein
MTSLAWGALGALSVLLLAAVLRRAAWRRRFRRGGPGPRAGARFLAARLGARPDQERVLAAEADALAAELSRARADLAGVRDELADLFAAPALDAAAVAAAIDARVARLAAVRARIADGLARVHATLDPPQRARLAELVRAGPHRRRCARA